MEQIVMRQFNAAGTCIDHSLWVCDPHDPFELHVLMYDVRLKGCVRFEVYSLAPSAGW